jgi:hypothetical protein
VKPSPKVKESRFYERVALPPDSFFAIASTFTSLEGLKNGCAVMREFFKLISVGLNMAAALLKIDTEGAF